MGCARAKVFTMFSDKPPAPFGAAKRQREVKRKTVNYNNNNDNIFLSNT